MNHTRSGLTAPSAMSASDRSAFLNMAISTEFGWQRPHWLRFGSGKRRRVAQRDTDAAVAVLGLAIALMSQSLGAILPLGAVLAISVTIGRSAMRLVVPLFLLLTVSLGAIYGKLPLRAFAEKTAIGRQMVEIVRSSGRQSLTWRIARDQTALALIDAHPVIGTARWDWWRKNNERPWNLAFLIFGQFGLIGLALAFGSLLMPALFAMAIRRGSGALGIHPTAPLAVIVLMASADALPNSFFFYPAILAAAALAPRNRSLEGPIDAERRRTVSLSEPTPKAPPTKQ